jgi:D-alanine-D-alanine ligase
MDKVATKSLALAIGCPATATAILDPRDDGAPLPLPFVVKPVHEGSTVGLFVCRTMEDWRAAHRASVASGKACMIEPYIQGRELTVGVIDRAALPIIEITPAEGLYDYEAKYNRSDTKYQVNPRLPAGVAERVAADTLKLAAAMGVRHLCRVDFMLDAQGRPWLLEANTMPGFTDHSLVPMAARAPAPAGPGMEMSALCARLVDLALRDASAGASQDPPGELAKVVRAGA